MYSTYFLSNEDSKKPHVSIWDGEQFLYTIFDNETEEKQERERLKKIDEEYNQKMKDYLEGR